MVVTGGGRGIGAATARLAAARGYKVCINYFRDEKSAAALASEIGGLAVQGDVASEPDVVRLFTVDAENQALLRRATEHPTLAAGWRDYFRKRLYDPDA